MLVQSKGGPLHCYGGSLYRALQDLYPGIYALIYSSLLETKWNKKWFRTSNRKFPLGFFRDPSNQKNFLNSIAAQYNIKEPSQWQRVSIKLLKKKGGAVQIFHHSSNA